MSGKGKGPEPNYKDEKVAIHIRYGKIYIVNLPYVKGDEELRRSQEFIKGWEFWEAQRRYEQRAEDREKMGLEDKDPAKTWRCPGEQELRLRGEEELHEGNDLNRAGIKKVEDETSLEDKNHHNMATREWTPLYEHNEQEKEMNKEASAANTTDDKQQPRQHNDSKQAEKYEFTGNAARSPEIISDGTCTPAKPENMTMTEQSPTDVSSLSWFEDLERNQSLSKITSKNPGVEVETQRHGSIPKTTQHHDREKDTDGRQRICTKQRAPVPKGQAVQDGSYAQSKQKTDDYTHPSSSDGCDQPTVAAGNNDKVRSLKPTTEWKAEPPDIHRHEFRDKSAVSEKKMVEGMKDVKEMNGVRTLTETKDMEDFQKIEDIVTTENILVEKDNRLSLIHI